MGKVKLLIFSIIACLFINVSALTYTEEEVVDRINSSKVSVNELLGDLINWSDTNKNATKKLVNKDFVKSINSLDFETNLNKTISKLRNSGEVKAANDLEALKSKLLNNYNSYKETLKITKTYLEERKDYGVNGNLDVFIAIRELAKYNKSSISSLGKIYYSDAFDYIYDNIDKYTIDEVISEFDYIYELDIVNKLFNKSDEFMAIYNDYHLEDYDDLFKDYFGSYYSTLKKDYYKLYDKLESKYQAILEKKVKEIVDNTDLTSDASITNRNNKLYELIDEIDLTSNKLNTRFNNIDSKIKIASIKKYTKEYQTEALNRFEEASNYVRKYIIDNLKLDVKNDSDRKDFQINMAKEMIVYSGTNLDISVIDKLVSNYGFLRTVNLFGNNVGTGSRIQIINNELIVKDFLFIVKGDVSASGRIDISDVVKMANKMFDKVNLSEIEMMAADMNDDNKIDITDIVLLCNKIFN